MSLPSIADLFKIGDKYFQTSFDKIKPLYTKLDLSKVPQIVESETFIGIEVEMENAYAIGSNDAVNHLWTFRGDGSLRNNGIEGVSVPVKGEFIRNAIVSLFDSIKQCYFSPRTSIHVHLDVRALTAKQLTAIMLVYLSVESLLYKFVGKDRHENIFCVPLYTTSMVSSLVDMTNNQLVKTNLANNRYAGLNLDSVRKFGTIEFRQMHGTHDVGKIVNWINLLLKVKQFALSHSLDELITQISALNTNSFYIAYLNEVFGDIVMLLDMTDLKSDLEKGVKAVKQSIISNKFVVELKKEFSKKSPAVVQYAKQAQSAYAKAYFTKFLEKVS